MLGGQSDHGWQLCFSLKLHAGGLDFRHFDGSNLKTYLLMRCRGLMIWLLLGPPGFTFSISFATVFSFIYC